MTEQNQHAHTAAGPIRPALWGLAIALIAGLLILGPKIVVPYTGQFSYLLSAISLALIYILWRMVGGIWVWIALPVFAAFVGWDGLYATWTRLAAIGTHAALSFLLFAVLLTFWWRWLGKRMRLGRFVLGAILFAIAGFIATWINSLYIDTESMTAALLQLEMVARNVLLGASFVLGLEIGEFGKRPIT